jgi:hypothetical protein
VLSAAPLFAVLGNEPALGQTPTPVAGDFQVNTGAATFHNVPDVGLSENGDAVVAWNDTICTELGNYCSGQFPVVQRIVVRRYDAAGAPYGPELLLDAIASFEPIEVQVDVADDGSFLLLLQGFGYAEGRRLTASGSPDGSPFVLFSGENGGSAHLASAPNGDLVVAWEVFDSVGDDEAVKPRRFDAQGTPLGSAFQVNTFEPGVQRSAWVAMKMDRSFIVVWHSDLATPDIRGRSFDAAGNPLGSEFPVGVAGLASLARPRVQFQPAGGFVVTWTSCGAPLGEDVSGCAVQARRFNGSGAPIGPQFQVNTFATGDQIVDDIDVARDGSFIVLWTSDGSAGSDTSEESIQGQRFDRRGHAVGVEFQLNDSTAGQQSFVRVDSDASGFLATWHEGALLPPTVSSIRGRRFTSPPLPPLVPSLGPGALALFVVMLALTGVRFWTGPAPGSPPFPC